MRIKKRFDTEEEFLDYAWKFLNEDNSLRYITESQLTEFLFLESVTQDCWDFDENGNPRDEDGNIIPEPSRSSIKLDKRYNIKFPIVFIGFIDSGFDRLGDYSYAFSEYVELNAN